MRIFPQESEIDGANLSVAKMDFLTKNLYNLHAIGEIPRGQKINTRGECLSAEKDSSFQWVKRLADGRSKVFRDINRYVSTVVEISSRIMESKYFIRDYVYSDAGSDLLSNNPVPSDGTRSDNIRSDVARSDTIPAAKKVNYDILKIRTIRIEELHKILCGLIEARRGIVGQQDTYKDDTDVCALILDLTTKIDQSSLEIKKFLHAIGEKTDD